MTGENAVPAEAGTVDPAAVQKYRELIGLMADERTLRGRQLQDLEAAMNALGLRHEDVEMDVKVLVRHRGLSAQLSDIRARIKAFENAAGQAAKEARHYAAKLEESRSRETDAQTKASAARQQITELDTLETNNPRLFATA